MSKISIARRRLELRNRAEISPHIFQPTSGLPLKTIGGNGGSESEVDECGKTLAFPIAEKDAQLIESLASENEAGRKELTGVLHRVGTILVLRIQPPITGKKLICCERVAEMLGMSKTYVYRLAHEGQLPTYRIGRMLRFDPVDVFAFMANCLDRSGIPTCT